MDRRRLRGVRFLIYIIAGLVLIHLAIITINGIHTTRRSLITRNAAFNDDHTLLLDCPSCPNSSSVMRPQKVTTTGLVSQTEEVMTERLTLLKQKCIETISMSHLTVSVRKDTRQIYANDKHNISVCTVPKSGCSFMKQVLIFLDNPSNSSENRELIYRKSNNKTQNHNGESIFKIQRKSIHSVARTLTLLNLTEFQRSNTMKVVFARNPYTRLFSAYIDKFFLPMFWQYIIYKRKKMLIAQNRFFEIYKCGSRMVSFETFLSYILEDIEWYTFNNEHWLPASLLCDPCGVKPDIIIKQETYKQDLLYFLDRLQLNKSDHDIIAREMGQSDKHSESILHGLIWTMYETTIKIHKKSQNIGKRTCFTRSIIAQRVWKALQIQGQISKRLKYPASEMRNLKDNSTEEVVNVFMRNIATLPITAEESREQRHEALVNAYKSVSMKTLVNLQAVFYQDFVQYGYSFDIPK